MNRGLTGKEKQIFDVICGYAAENKSPSVREICEKTDVGSVSTVWRYLKSLEEKGVIAVDRNVARGITLLHGGGRVPVNLPLISDMDPITKKTDFDGELFPFVIPDKYRDRCYAFVSKDNVAEIKAGDRVVFLLADIVPNGFLAAVRTVRGLKIGAVFHKNEYSVVILDGTEYRIGSEADVAVVGRIIGFARDFL